jgi:biotin transport system substrate-specific component
MRALAADSTFAKDAALVGMGAALTAALAQVQVPWEPVPFTLQTLGVAACGLALGMRKAVASQAVYLGMGIAGLPVFAGGKAGVWVVFGPTGGYLLAFLFAAALLGWVSDRKWDRTAWKLGAGMAAALLGVLVFGTAWLAIGLGSWERAVALGFVPFVLPEIMKALLVALGLPGLRRFLS